MSRSIGPLAAVVVLLVLAGCSSAQPTASTARTKASENLGLPSHVVNVKADASAAAVLVAEDTKLSAGVAEGKTAIGTDAQIAWWKSFGDSTRLQGEILNVFKTADGYFDASDEAPSISAWRDTSLPGDVLAWYQSDTGSGPSAATTQTVESDIASMENAAAAVAKGQ